MEKPMESKRYHKVAVNWQELNLETPTPVETRAVTSFR